MRLGLGDGKLVWKRDNGSGEHHMAPVLLWGVGSKGLLGLAFRFWVPGLGMRTACRTALARLHSSKFHSLGKGSTRAQSSVLCQLVGEPEGGWHPGQRWLTLHTARRWSGGDPCPCPISTLLFALAARI